jgi:iron(III) transport system substrate-binding protein
MAAFHAKYPFLEIASGFFSAPTGRVLARVNAEIDAKHVSFDVMLAANVAAWVQMTHDGKIMQYVSPEYATFPAGAKQDGYWATSQAIGVIPVYNKNVMTPPDAPKSWSDLLLPPLCRPQDGDPERRGRHAVQLDLSVRARARP